jgi:hypothetical protein
VTRTALLYAGAELRIVDVDAVERDVRLIGAAAADGAAARIDAQHRAGARVRDGRVRHVDRAGLQAEQPTTLFASSGRLRTCSPLIVLPIEASVVLMCVASAVTFTTSVIAPICMTMSSLLAESTAERHLLAHARAGSRSART